MSSIREKVFRELDLGRICVFPTEIQARFYLQEYARFGSKRMIFESQTMAWDEFYKLFLPSHDDKRPSDNLIRKLFANWFTTLDVAQRLRHFSMKKYELASEGLASSVSSMLPQLTFADEMAPGEMKSDVLLIRSEYEKFMERSGLYEPRWDIPAVPLGMDVSQYCICFPEAIDGYELFKHALGNEFTNIVTLDLAQVATALEVFPNALAEMRVQMRRIRNLLSDGVNCQDILVTCMKLDSIRPYLEREARRKDIPISILENLKLTAYSAGKFFFDLKNVLNEDFSLASMENLFLCEAYPWKDGAGLRRMIKDGILALVVCGKNEWESKLNGESLVIFRSASNLIEAFGRSRTADEIRRAFNAFQDEMFVPQSFLGESELSRAVYSYCVRQLKTLETAMQVCNLEKMDGLYGIFVGILSETPYVPQKKSEGITVMNYPQTTGLYPLHHFIIGVSQDAAVVRKRYVSYIPDSISGNFFIDPIDRTDQLLALSSLSGQEVRMSGAVMGFDSASLCPPLFLAQKMKKDYAGELSSDEYDEELDFWAGADSAGFYPNRNQRCGFLAYRTCFMDKISEIEPYKMEKKTFSATMLDAYLHCPFKYLCQYGFVVMDKQYDPSHVDYAELGSLLHRVMERFFTKIGTVVAAKNEEYKLMLLALLDEEFEQLQKSSSMSEPTLINQQESMRRTIAQGVDFKVLDGLHVIGTEIKLESKEPLWTIQGRIDLLFKSDEGDFGVLDLKRGTFGTQKKQMVKVSDVEENGLDSVQLLVYSRLVKNSKGELARWAAFYSFSDRKFYFGWTDEDGAKLADGILEKRVELVNDGIDKGDFNPTPGDWNCKGCGFFPVCRRRYVIR